MVFDEKAIFVAALEVPDANARETYLQDVCGDHPELLDRLRKLLSAHAGSHGPLDRLPAALGSTLASAYTAAPGMVIGPYKLIEEVGEGGMATVWMAQQTEPVKRLVAVKLIKAGMDSKLVIARFEAERQALALMDHPSIARVLDGGTTDTGRPYFVMDLVKGVPITRYCDEHRLTARQRLELFIPVCHAIQHAHQKGIIHRDLKPSNILVALYDSDPVPKVIDFGVAKATAHSLTDRTLVTGYGSIVGTLEYMSPEQASFNQLDIDTRSDVYSLGVLLYELLTGSPPHVQRKLDAAGLLETLRVIREQVPTKPSTKLATAEGLPSLAANRGIEPAKLTALVRGELDWIVMKALEKDRGRRYESVSAFAADIVSYLRDEPVSACPPTLGYRFRKFTRRHQAVLLSTALVVLALITGTVVSIWLAVRATRAETGALTDRDRARRAEEQAKQEVAIAAAVNEFLNEDLLAQAAPGRTPDRDLKLRAVLDRASQRIEGRFRDQPLVEARLRSTLATTYESLGEYQVAERHAQRARELYQDARGAQHPDTLGAMHNLARIFSWQGRQEQARQLFDEVLALRRRVLGADHPDTLKSQSKMATVLRQQGQFEEARRLHNETLEVLRRVLGTQHPDTLSSMSDLAVVLFQQERLGEACQLQEEALLLQRRVLGVEHPDTLGSMHNLAHILFLQGRGDEARKLYEEALDVQRRVLGSAHMETVASINNLAWLLATAPDAKVRAPARAVELATELARMRPDEGNTWNTLGTAHYRAGNWTKAIAALERSMELNKGVDSYNSFFLAMAHWQLGMAETTTVQENARHRLEARQHYDSAVAWMEKNRPGNEELIRFRAEAAELMGIKEQPPPKTKMN